MGANLRTFAVRRSDRLEVRNAVASWLGAKGLKTSAEASLFPFDPDTERGVVLSETPDWTVVAFSHGWEEGDRLLFEFLARFSSDDKLVIDHPAEKRVLWDMTCQLENVLVEPLAPDYRAILERARRDVGE